MHEFFYSQEGLKESESSLQLMRMGQCDKNSYQSLVNGRKHVK